MVWRKMVAVLGIAAGGCHGSSDDSGKSGHGDATSKPVATVTLSPANPTTVDVVSAAVEIQDPNAGVPTLTYVWRVDGDKVSETGSSLDGDGAFDRDQVVEVTVVATVDGVDSEPATASVVVVNSAPLPPVVEITPAAPTPGDALTCTVVTPSADADGDIVSYTFSWEVDGVAHPGATVGALDTAANQEWTCTVVPDDGTDPGTAGVASVTVGTCSPGMPVTLTTANGAFSVATADLDGDGDDDILATAGIDNLVFWLEAQGGGTFGAAAVITNLALNPSDAEAEDLDGDGDLDVVVSSRDDDTIGWYENLGGGAFGPENILTSTADFARGLDLEDLDGDGDIDVVYAAELANEVGWIENLGAGSFDVPVPVVQGNQAAHSVYATDLDGDLDADILVGAWNANTPLSWHENLGAGSFGPPQMVSGLPGQVIHVFAADLDGDDDQDVLSASFMDDRVAWFENLGGASWGPMQTLSNTARAAYAVTAGDIDGDGDPDVAYASQGDAEVGWFENLGGGSFAAGTVLTPQGFLQPSSVCIGDFDSDGDPDLAAAATGLNVVAWFENSCTP